MAPFWAHEVNVPLTGKEMLRPVGGERPTVEVNDAEYVPLEEAMRVSGVAVPRTQRGF